MAIGLVGKKCGMTRIFSEDGNSIPVTVVEALPNKITQIKTLEKDGYSAIQVTTGAKRASHVSKPMANHFAKADVDPGIGLWEFRCDDVSNFKGDDAAADSNSCLAFKVGDVSTIDIFTEGQVVDVSGVSKGKGFQGTIKRHNFKGQPASHGNSLAHRVPGSIGQNQCPRHVFKNKKMPGRMGGDNNIVQNQQIVKIDLQRNLLLIKGAIPGAPGGIVMVLPSCKAKMKDKN